MKQLAGSSSGSRWFLLLLISTDDQAKIFNVDLRHKDEADIDFAS